jgi:hypothetical protein
MQQIGHNSAPVPFRSDPVLDDSTYIIKSESESEFLYDWRFAGNQFLLATSPLGPTTRIFIFQMNICSHSPYVTPSLMR